ncbi:MAG: hypothetical protein HAW61_03275 [Candidatus Portiera sp.]|nr:hypothetical protein [Portiera sp.]
MLNKLIEPLAKGVFGLIDKLHLSKQEKLQFKERMQSMVLDHQKEVEKTLQEQARSTADIIVAEVKQDDKYTKRARPTVIYVGIILIIWGYVIAPLLNGYYGAGIVIEIPDFFWHSWAAIVAVYAGGRSYEKSKKLIPGSDSEGVG